MHVKNILAALLSAFSATVLPFAAEGASEEYPLLRKEIKRASPDDPRIWVEFLSFDEYNKNACIELSSGGEPQDFTPRHSSWYADMRKYTLGSYSKKKLVSTWKEYSFVFVPKKSGRVWIHIGGRWSREDSERNWVLVNWVKLNGTYLPNGDFVLFRELSKERNAPEKWRLGWNAKYFQTGGEKETPACLVNHDNRLSTSFPVEGGKKHTVTIKARTAKGRYAPAHRKKNKKLIF